MNNIDQHISNLLMQHNCVVVPRLGGFVGSYQAAVAEDSGIMKPPHKEIIFNRALSHNDGLLINTYSRSLGISYSEAEKSVELFVDGLLDQLAAGEFVQIAEVGTLRSDLSGNLYFIQSEGVNFLAHSFGFESIHVTPLTLLEQRSHKIEGRSKVFVRMLTNPRVAASIAAAVGLFLFTTDISIKEVENFSYGSLFNGLSVETTQVVPSITNADTVVVKPLLESVASRMKSDRQNIAQENKPFHLVAASAKSEDEAKKLLELFVKAGKHNAKIVEAEGRFRISIEQFTSKTLAIECMKSYRSDAEYKSVWVFKEK